MSFSVPSISGLSSRLPQLPESLTDILGAFISQATRLLEIHFSTDGGIPEGKFLVHRLKGTEAINAGFKYEVWVLSQDAHFPLKTLLSVPVQIRILTDSGGKRLICGVVTEVHSEGSDGGMATYRLVVEPITAALRLGHGSQIFMQKNDLEIVKLILNKEIHENPVFGACFSIDDRCLKSKTYPVRDFAFLCDDNKWDFICRRLAKIGVSFVIAPSPDSNPEHPQHTLILFDDPRDLDQNEAGEVRFHRADGTEQRDTITGWQAQRVLQVGRITRRAWDHSNGALSTTSENLISDQGRFGNALASTLEDYRHEAPIEHDNLMGHEKATTSRAQVREQRTKAFAGVSTVRDFCAGTSFVLDDHPVHDADPRAQRTFVLTGLELEAENNFGGLKTGHEAAQVYTNRFECLRQGIPILPEAMDGPAPGLITATVVGPENEEAHTNPFGAIKVRIHGLREEDHPEAGATNTDRDSTWVRLLQPWSSQGMGGSFLPRAGDEVVLQFLNNDPDKPVILGVLPGGQRRPATFSEVSSLPGDKAISGMRSRMLKGSGGNELLFDDSTNELRARLASDHAKTELNLGHIVHPRAGGVAQAKGSGFELRSRAYGTLRGEMGLLLSTEGGQAALEAGALHAQLERGHELTQALSEAAEQHKTEKLGTLDVSKSHQEALKQTQTLGGTQIPAFAKPLLALSSPAGIVQGTLASSHTSAGEHIHLDSGGDTVIAAGKRIMMAAKDAFSLFAAKSGIKLFAGKGNVEIQAHEGELSLAGHKDVKVVSSEGVLELMAKNGIRLCSGGAELLIKDGQVTISTPGSYRVEAGKVELAGPKSMDVHLPELPKSDWGVFSDQAVLVDHISAASRKGIPYEVVGKDGAILAKGETDEEGKTQRWFSGEKSEPYSLWVGKGSWEFDHIGSVERAAEIDFDENDDNAASAEDEDEDEDEDDDAKEGQEKATEASDRDSGMPLWPITELSPLWDFKVQDRAGQPISGLELFLEIEGKTQTFKTDADGLVTGLPRSDKPISFAVKKEDGGQKKVADLEVHPNTEQVLVTSPKIKLEGRTRYHGKDAKAEGGQASKQVAQPPVNKDATPAPQTKTVANGPYCFPMLKQPTDSYKTGCRRFKAPRGTRTHAGCDLYGPEGTPVVSMADGEIIDGPRYFDIGTYQLSIKFIDGVIARYTEISRKVPSGIVKGAKVTRGQIVGYMKTNNTRSHGCMLHLELYKGTGSGSLTDPSRKPYLRRADLMDPTPILDKAPIEGEATSGTASSSTESATPAKTAGQALESKRKVLPWLRKAVVGAVRQTGNAYAYNCYCDGAMMFLSPEVQQVVDRAVAPTVRKKGTLVVPVLGQGNSFQARNDEKHPVTVVGVESWGNNLKLGPNEEFRPALMAAAKRVNMLPQVLASVVNAECAKLKSGKWNKDCVNKKSKATGMGQFLGSTWLGLAVKPGNHLHDKAKELGYVKSKTNQNKSKKGKTSSKTVWKIAFFSKGKILDLRLDPEIMLTMIGQYGWQNLDSLKRAGFNVYGSGLNQVELARLMYLAHFLGPRDAARFIRNTLTEDRSKYLLSQQGLGQRTLNSYLKLNSNEYKLALRDWWNKYNVAHIAPNDNFTVKPAPEFSGDNLSKIIPRIGGTW